CRSEAHDTAERRRHSKGPAEVRALGERAHAGGNTYRGASARAATGQRGIPRVAGGAKYRIEGVSAGPELGAVGLADHDGAGRLESLDHEVVLVWNVVLIDERAPCRANSLGRIQILDRHRHAVEWSQGSRLSAQRRGRSAGRR